MFVVSEKHYRSAKNFFDVILEVNEKLRWFLLFLFQTAGLCSTLRGDELEATGNGAEEFHPWFPVTLRYVTSS